MQIEDRVTISTPEGVDLELTLAGVGSRFTSAIVDFVIQLALLGALAVLFFGIGGSGGGVGVAIFTVVYFLLFAGYDIVFEVFASGRTPGKRLNGLRVVRDDGSPITFVSSAVRNVLRLIDFLPGLYTIGILSILASPKNQRLGDLAAGSLVVRERKGTESSRRRALAPFARSAPAGAPAPDAPWASWDVSGVTTDELVAVRRFLERRDELTYDARRRLAFDLAQALEPKVAGVQAQVRGEAFLEQLAQAKASRG